MREAVVVGDEEDGALTSPLRLRSKLWLASFWRRTVGGRIEVTSGEMLQSPEGSSEELSKPGIVASGDCIMAGLLAESVNVVVADDDEAGEAAAAGVVDATTGS
ncbi:unnamed protein product, partial [Durusdinium trenchii]